MNVMIIPAAGRGTRLDFDGPKLMFPLKGKPLIAYLLARYRPYVDRYVIVINPQDESEVVPYLKGSGYSYELAYQAIPTGMLDAILAPMDQLKKGGERPKQVWVSWCDQVGITDLTARTMKQRFDDTGVPCLIFPTIEKPDPYIHMQRNEKREIVYVRQRREGDEMPLVGENDCGLFGLSEATYFDLLPNFSASIADSSEPSDKKASLKLGANTKERNFLPFISWMKDRGRVVTYSASNVNESIGINTVSDAEQLSLCQLTK